MFQKIIILFDFDFLSPGYEQVQAGINSCVVAIIGVSKEVKQWDSTQKDGALPEEVGVT